MLSSLFRRALGRPRSQVYRRRKSDRLPRAGWIPSLVIIGIVACTDWLTKALVVATIPLDGFVEVWSGRVALWHVRNPAMILGLHGNLPLFWRQVITVVAAILASIVLVQVVNRGHRLSEERQRHTWLCVGLAFGGMLGNFGERLIFWHVTDFLSFRWGSVWLPPGNVADVAVFASLPLCALVIRYELEARRQRRPIGHLPDGVTDP